MFTIIFFICRVRHYKNFCIINCNNDYCILIYFGVPYIPSFLGLWIYTIVLYSKFYIKNESVEIAKRIKADKFIEEFLKEFCDHFKADYFIILIMVLLPFSILIYISIYLVRPIYNYIEKRRNRFQINESPFRFRRNRQNTRNINIINNKQIITENIQINSNIGSNRNLKQNDINTNKMDTIVKVDNINPDEQKINKRVITNIKNTRENTKAEEEEKK